MSNIDVLHISDELCKMIYNHTKEEISLTYHGGCLEALLMGGVVNSPESTFAVLDPVCHTTNYAPEVAWRLICFRSIDNTQIH